MSNIYAQKLCIYVSSSMLPHNGIPVLTLLRFPTGVRKTFLSWKFVGELYVSLSKQPLVLCQESTAKSNSKVRHLPAIPYHSSVPTSAAPLFGLVYQSAIREPPYKQRLSITNGLLERYRSSKEMTVLQPSLDRSLRRALSARVSSLEPIP